MARFPVFLALLCWLAPAAAQAQAPDVRGTVDGTLGIQQQTQVRKDEWAQQAGTLQSRYRTAKADVAYLEARRDYQAGQVQALEARIAEFERRLGEAVRLRNGIGDTLSVILDRLETHVARDLPFLPEERAHRLASLKAELARPDVSSAEKLRRLLEALQVEAGYGGTVELNPQEIALDGSPLSVDVLRIGRLSLFWRTPDGKRAGEYDRASASWRELPRKHARAIGEAMDMAARVRPTELIALPLGRIAR
ncbi:MAG: DUF3450 domain-containing protein [bacterium]|nr:DUF3450 domain-containing protein [bacterium]